jgi:hypothetical protein
MQKNITFISYKSNYGTKKPKTLLSKQDLY